MSRSRSRSRSRGRRSPSPSASSSSRAAGPVRTIFIGNIPRSTTTTEIEKLVGAFGPVARVDLKDRFAFVGMVSQLDADRVVKELHKTSFNGLTISAEFAKRDEAVRTQQVERERNAQPTKVLFVVNYMPDRTETDLRELFHKFGPITKVEKRATFALIQFDAVEDASAALKELNGHKEKDGREIKVQFSYAHRDGIKPERDSDSYGYSSRRDADGGGRDYDRRDRDRRRDSPYSRRRSRSRSPRRDRSPPRRRSRTPPRRDRSPPRRDRSPPPRRDRRSRSRSK